MSCGKVSQSGNKTSTHLSFIRFQFLFGGVQVRQISKFLKNLKSVFLLQFRHEDDVEAADGPEEGRVPEVPGTRGSSRISDQIFGNPFFTYYHFCTL